MQLSSPNERLHITTHSDFELDEDPLGCSRGGGGWIEFELDEDPLGCSESLGCIGGGGGGIHFEIDEDPFCCSESMGCIGSGGEGRGGGIYGEAGGGVGC